MSEDSDTAIEFVDSKMLRDLRITPEDTGVELIRKMANALCIAADDDPVVTDLISKMSNELQIAVKHLHRKKKRKGQVSGSGGSSGSERRQMKRRAADFIPFEGDVSGGGGFSSIIDRRIKHCGTDRYHADQKVNRLSSGLKR